MDSKQKDTATQNNNRSLNTNVRHDIDDIKDKWLVNLSNVQLPKYAIDTLSLGEKFNFSIGPNKRTIVEYVKDIENGVRINDLSINIREDLITTLNNFIKKQQKTTYQHNRQNDSTKLYQN